MAYIIYILYCIIIYFYVFACRVSGLNINSSNDFLSGIENREENLFLQNDIKIDANDVIKIQSKKVIISGRTKSTIFQFTNNNSVNLSFLENCEEIELKNLSITGNFKFNNNKNITFNNVIFNGYFISENNNDISENSRLQLLNSEFHLISQFNGYEIHNYHLTIENSQIYGNDMLNLSLISIINDENSIKNTIIDNSYFTGNYWNSAINIEYSDITCSNSVFEKFHGIDLNSGGALDLFYTDNEFYNNTFIDNFTRGHGGSIYFKFPINTLIDDITFRNTSSFQSGGAFSIFNNDDGIYSNITINSINHFGNVKRNKFSTEGTLFSISGLVNLKLDNYNGYNINTGSLMTFEGDGIANITRMNIDEIYSQNDGAVIKAHNQKNKGLQAFFDQININEIIQENTSYSAAFISTSSGCIEMHHLNISSVRGIKSGLTYSELYSRIYIRFSEISNFYSRFSEPIFNINNIKPCEESSLELELVKINNIYENGVLFYNYQCTVTIFSSEFNNIHECYKYNDCTSFKEPQETKSEVAIAHYDDSESFSYLEFKNCTFNEVYGKRGMFLKGGTIDMFDSEIKNSYFQYGFLYYTNLYVCVGSHTFDNIIFKDNNSEIGTFLYFDDIGNKRSILLINIYNIQFLNNTASNYGGILYSNARRKTDIKEYFKFKNCTFENNNAMFGKISYIYDDDHAPSYDGIDADYMNQLKMDKNNFVTNPTHLEFDNYNNTEVLIVHSDERIEMEYSCSIYDDYGNKFTISDGINDALLDDLIIYELSLINVNDKYQPTKIYGSYKGYCLNSSCKIKDLRLVGKPGDYILELKIVSFGRFYEFRDNTIGMNVKILECNETEYINQDKNGINIKSCYKPVCNPSCVNNGICVNDNVCDCQKTHFTGSTCSERYKQKRYKGIDLIFRISSYILITVTSITFIILFHYRKEKYIKSASYDFMNIILFGTFLNYIYAIIMTKENYDIFDCKISFILNNLAYTLIYGSIIAKTSRIYYIFFILKKRFNKNIITIIKVLPIGFLLLVHSFVSFLLFLTNSVKTVKALDSEEHEYIKCDYSRVSMLSSLVNIFTIIMGSLIAYGIRNTNRTFQEPLSIPIYSYVVYILLYYIMVSVNNNRLIYYIDMGGTLIYSIVILFFLYIVKFYNMHFAKIIIKNESNSRCIQYQNCSVHALERSRI